MVAAQDSRVTVITGGGRAWGEPPRWPARRFGVLCDRKEEESMRAPPFVGRHTAHRSSTCASGQVQA